VSGYPEVAGPDPARTPALGALLDDLRRRHGDAVEAVLLYGSCLRDGDIFDGLLDLYLVVESYARAYDSGFLAAANRLLPPNVFYAEAEREGRTLRAKVAVISLRDFRRGCSRRWFQPYIWGRFAQPASMIFCRDARVRETVEDCLFRAAYTLLRRGLPVVPPEGTVEQLWTAALELSYGTELRAERAGRAAELVAAGAKFYERVTPRRIDSPVLDFEVYDADGETRYRCRMKASTRRIASLHWFGRRVQGKALSVARLVKALFTFEGGLDYIAWKLERHSGQEIAIPDKVRRLPLVYLWPYFWGLYRRGIFK